MDGPSGKGEAPRAPARAPYLLLGLLVLIAAAIGGTAWKFHLQQKAAFESEVRGRLLAIADGKVRQINEWWAGRLGEARTLMEDAVAMAAIQRVIERRATSDERARVSDLMAAQCRNLHYAGAVLVDLRGNVHLLAGRRFGDDTHFQDLMQMVLRRGDIVQRDSHLGESGDTAHLGVNVPLRAAPGSPIFGAVMFSIDSLALAHTLTEWPVPTRSGEVMLVHREGDTVLYLTNLRGRPGAALNFRVPLERSDLAVVKAVNGVEGNLEAVDYRGVPVFAAARAVPGTDWYVVAKLDSEEVWEPLRRGSTMLGVTAASLALALGALLFVLWRRHQVAVYRELCESAVARRALAEQYDYLSRFANDVILLLDPDGAIVRANDRAVESYGYSLEVLAGMNLRSLRTPDALRAFEADWRMAGERESMVYETTHRASDNREFPVEVSMRALRVEKRVYRQAIIRDISERKMAEMELSQSEARLRQLVEHAPYGIVVLDGLEMLFANPAAHWMFGAEHEGDLVGCSLLQFVDAAECEQVVERARQFRAGIALGIIERRYRRFDGRTFWALVSTTAIEYNECPATLLFYQDITEKKQAEEQRAALEEQLRQAQKIESVGRLAGGVAHDFNNYLTVINGYCDMLLADAPHSGELRDGLQEIRAAGERAASVTSQLLAFSRKQLADPRPICLNRTVTDSGKLLRRLIGENIEFVTSLEDPLDPVMVDPGQIDQLIMNLAINARDAMPSGGRIEIATRKVRLEEGGVPRNPLAHAGDYAVLSVSDTGVGIAPEIQQKIFEPFFTTKRVGHGTGLGLCTAYGIVNHAGGWIEVDSLPGHGATFRVWLPVTKAAKVDESAAVASAVASPREATLLVVEDQADVRRLALSILKLQGYRLLEAENADRALEVSGNYAEAIDLLVTDVVMPGRTGRELAESLAAQRPGIKVLYISGYSGDAIAAHGCLDPETEYLPKPFSPEQLTSKVREVLCKPQRPSRTILVIDDDAEVNGLLRHILTGAGYHVVVACDGKKGMDVLERQPVDLVITDLVMPEQEGLETVTRLHAQRPKLPVIAISGAFGGSFLKAAGMLGATATLAKPIAADTLLRVVEQSLGS
uniref:histidine kinase n=1 Tax=Solibacter usitatus (strain Ellin6076) TaxID=234267 RepID=Q020C1_SOLUE